ncbi:hypothetical protein [Candidatus Harpocratesius sp.]
MQKQLLVYGGGKFGSHVFEKFHERFRLFIIDSDPNCSASSLPISKDYSANWEHIRDQINHTKNSLFILGDIEIVMHFLEEIPFEYLIPVVPIHVMKEILLRSLNKWFPKIDFKDGVIPPIPTDLIPKELQIFSDNSHTLFFSYAKWEEKCPINCSGPLGYCPIHKRLKPISITDLCRTAWPNPSNFLFESYQLAPGIGGIPSIEIREKQTKLRNLCEKKLNAPREIKSAKLSEVILVCTTCNCHGVASGLTYVK